MTKNVAGKTWNLTVQNGRRWSAGPPSGLAFSSPPAQALTPYNTANFNLGSYVAGGNSTKWFSAIAGSLPLSTSLGLNSGIISGTVNQIGTFTPTIQVSDSIAEALEADWVARSTATGVQWAHDFRSDTEVSKYRLKKYDYGTGQYVTQLDGSGTPLTRRITTDGITGGGCLELFTPNGQHNNMSWCRPFIAFPGDAGYGGGADLPASWDTAWTTYRRGLYGHPDYHSVQTGAGIEWSGHDFWIQFRYKVSASAFPYPWTHAFNSGKVIFIDLGGGGNQALIIQSPVYKHNRYWMYTNYSRASNGDLRADQTNYNNVSLQPGGDYAYTCFGSTLGGCWLWPTEEWVTVLIHVIPGHQNAGDGNQVDLNNTAIRKDTGIEVYAARYGDTQYTKIWSKFDYIWYWDAQTGANTYGFNTFVASQFMNNDIAGADWWRRFDQIIFSTQYIECPKVYA